MQYLLVGLLVSVICIGQIHGHGMVTDPPNRSSMWRYGYDKYPPNYDDDGLDCGGFGEQWDQNGGKCGLCGDDYSLPTPRPNEDGGTYGLGEIGGKYAQGHTMNITVKLTTSHLGFFQFSICNMDGSAESEECFEKHQLKFADGADKFYIKSNDQDKNYKFELQLPTDLACKHCVLRWHYKTGNSWGQCDDGTEGMGCGQQETFRTCSDIAINAAAKESQNPIQKVIPPIVPSNNNKVVVPFKLVPSADNKIPVPSKTIPDAVINAILNKADKNPFIKIQKQIPAKNKVEVPVKMIPDRVVSTILHTANQGSSDLGRGAARGPSELMVKERLKLMKKILLQGEKL